MGFRGGSAGGALTFGPVTQSIEIGDGFLTGGEGVAADAGHQHAFPAPPEGYAETMLSDLPSDGGSGAGVRSDARILHTADMHLEGGHASLIPAFDNRYLQLDGSGNLMIGSGGVVWAEGGLQSDGALSVEGGAAIGPGAIGSSGSFVTIVGDGAGTGGVIGVTSSDTHAGLDFHTQGSGVFTFVGNAGELEISAAGGVTGGGDAAFGEGTGGVSGNFIVLGNQADATAVHVRADGVIANVGLKYTTKGTGDHEWFSDSTKLAVLHDANGAFWTEGDGRFGSVDGSAMYLQIGDGGSSTRCQIAALGPSANYDLLMQGKGTGKVYTGTKFAVGTAVDMTNASSAGTLGLSNVGSAPSGNPSNGGFLYVQAGALKYIGTSGTTTTIAPA